MARGRAASSLLVSVTISLFCKSRARSASSSTVSGESSIHAKSDPRSMPETLLPCHRVGLIDLSRTSTSVGSVAQPRA
jgi:hypothetical protein